MSKPQILTFTEFDRARFERMRATFGAKGLVIEGDQGTIHYGGAEVDYSFTEASEQLPDTLTLTVNRAPFLHSFSGFCVQLYQTVEAQK